GGRTGRSRSISRGRVAWLYPSSTIDWRRWPSARASGRADASTDRGARDPRRARRASDTWCESSSDTRLHRATSHKQRLENDPGNVLRVDEPEPHPVPPGGERVPARPARTLRRARRRYSAPPASYFFAAQGDIRFAEFFRKLPDPTA